MRNVTPFGSVGTRLALGISLVVLVSMLASKAVLTEWQWEALLRRQGETAAFQVEQLALSTAAAVEAGDWAQVQAALDRFRIRGVLYVRIDPLDEGGARRAIEQRSLDFIGPVPAARPGPTSHRELGAHLLATTTLKGEAGKSLATVSAVFSLQAEREAHAELSRQIVWTSVGVGGLLTLALLVLARVWVTRPVNRLVDAVLRLKAGERVSAGLGSGDELGALGEAFDSMAETIAAREAALAGRNRELRLVLDNAPAAIAMLDRELRYVACSQRWLSDHRLKDDIIGRRQDEASPVVAKLWAAARDRCLQGSVERSDEARVELPDGVVRFMRWEAQPWFERPHHVGGIVMVTEDVTERHRLTELLRVKSQETQSVLDELRFQKFALDEHAIVSEIDAQGLVTWLNPRFCELVARPLGELQGTSIRELLVTQEGAAQWVDVLETLRRSRAWHGELCFKGRDGAKRWLASTLASATDAAGRVERCVGIHTDITAQKQAQAMVEIRAQQLEKAMARAEAADRAKSDFLMAMSHELRAPMNDVVSGARLLGQTRLDDEQRAFVQKIQIAGEQFVGIISDIVDYAKIEAGAFRIEPAAFDLRESLAEAIELYADRALEKGLFLGIDLSEDVPRRVYADAARIRQVLLNLIGNSVKFTEAGHVFTRVTREGNHIRFEIEDTGPGVEPEVRSQLFSRFMSAEGSAVRRQGMAGLGLAISHRCTELMGGSIGLKSSSNRGSCFYFTVEVEVLEEAAPPAPTALASSRILVFDPVRPSRELVVGFCRRWGAQVDAVSSEDAVLPTLLGGRSFDVLVVTESAGVDLMAIVMALRGEPKLETMGVVRTFSTARGQARVEGTLFDAAFGLPLTRGEALHEALLAAATVAAERRAAAAAGAVGAPGQRLELVPPPASPPRGTLVS